MDIHWASSNKSTVKVCTKTSGLSPNLPWCPHSARQECPGPGRGQPASMLQWRTARKEQHLLMLHSREVDTLWRMPGKHGRNHLFSQQAKGRDPFWHYVFNFEFESFLWLMQVTTKNLHSFPELLWQGTAAIFIEALLKTQQVSGKKTRSKYTCCDIYCYKISSFSELTGNSLENFCWEQKPGKTQLPRFCFDYCIGGSLLFYPARKLLVFGSLGLPS